MLRERVFCHENVQSRVIVLTRPHTFNNFRLTRYFLTSFINKYAFHLLYPVVYVGFLLLDKQWYSRNNDWLTYFPTFITHLALMFSLVYFNTLVLIPRLLLKRRVMAYTAGILITIAAYTLLRSLYTRYSFYWLFDLPEPEPITTFLWLSFVYGVWFTVVSSMLYITQNWYEQKQRVKAAEVSQLRTELKYLRAQMNPHFLFNGLNTIYGSIDMNNLQAREILLQFSDLLRYTIYEADTDVVPLEKEVKHLENYVALQKARSNANVRIDLSVSLENVQVPVAPMLFMPLLENAFKFVTRDDQRDNYVVISLQQSGNTIQFRCSNSRDREPHEEGGIGLVNIKRRLDLLYGERHRLTIEETDSDYTVALMLVI